MVSLGDLGAKILGGAKTPDDTLKLLVNGKQYEGWQGITVKRSIKAISGAFDLSVVTKWADQMIPWEIIPGDACSVLIGKEKLITGYVDDVNPKLDAGEKSVNVAGRDKTGDLVDCSFDENKSNWTNISLLSLCQRMAKPFGIGVTVDASATSAARTLFTSLPINQGEAAFEILDRAAKARGVLLTNDGNGNIVITRPGKQKASSDLVQGQNILTAEGAYSMKERFSRYKVKSQTHGLDGAAPEVDFSAHATANDPGVKRFRPIVIVSESAADVATCRIRANWEASVRVGKSSHVTVTVPGWRQGDGTLWRPNQICRVRAPGIGINADLLITEVTLKKANEGTLTSMLLEPVSAYIPDPTLIQKTDLLRQLVLRESKRK